MGSRQSAGGKSRGIIQRIEAIDRYYKNPKICKFCGFVIDIGPEEKCSAIRRKQFCDSSCCAKYGNEHRKKKVYSCRHCGCDILGCERKSCDECIDARKDIVGKKRKKDSNKREIYNHSRRVFRGGACERCGYSVFTEACHVTPIRSFPGTAMVSEINDNENVLSLCPNCHWEFDHKMFFINDISRK
jgi:hypothetical protein